MSAVDKENETVTLKEKLRRIFRGTLFQAKVLSLVSFTQPGIWGALNNLGAGGQAEPYIVNAANVVTFAIMVVFSPLFGVVCTIYGMKWVLLFGTLGYAPYSAALYCNSVYGTQWFLVFGAATCGLSASALWTSEAAIAVGYPEPARRGLYIAIWIAINKIGSVIAGAIQLAINANINAKGAIAPKTYLVLVALQCLGPLLALLISPPDKIIRSDGTKPIFGKTDYSFKSELKALELLFTRKEILLLLPIFISNPWGGTYNGNFLAAYFTVRARALMAFIVAIMGMVLNVVTGGVLDIRRYRSSVHGYVDLEYTTADRLRKIVGKMVFLWAYWILGTYDSHSDVLALSTGVLRSGESLGQTFAYAVGSSKHTSLLVNLIVAAVVFWASAPTTTWAAWLVPDVPKGELENRSNIEDNEPGVKTIQVQPKL